MFATYKAWSSDNTLSGLSVESLLDLGMSLPNTVGHNDHEMPPKHGQICGCKGALLTGIWPLPAASTKIKSRSLQHADFQHPLERSSGWRQKNKALCALGKTWKNKPSDSQRFYGKDFISPNSCIFSYLEKH